jgi:hypothetical protein
MGAHLKNLFVMRNLQGPISPIKEILYTNLGLDIPKPWTTNIFRTVLTTALIENMYGFPCSEWELILILLHYFQVKKFGSEPDLRQSKAIEERTRGKKKYKAPPPPNLEMVNKKIFVVNFLYFLLVGRKIPVGLGGEFEWRERANPANSSF